MIGLSTGRYSFIRGEESVDEYGDTESSDTVVHSNVLGSVIERTRRDFNPESGRISTQVIYVGRFPHGTDLRDGDRIKDEKSGQIFLVNSVGMGTSLVSKADVVADLSSTS